MTDITDTPKRKKISLRLRFPLTKVVENEKANFQLHRETKTQDVNVEESRESKILPEKEYSTQDIRKDEAVELFQSKNIPDHNASSQKVNEKLNLKISSKATGVEKPSINQASKESKILSQRKCSTHEVQKVETVEIFKKKNVPGHDASSQKIKEKLKMKKSKSTLVEKVPAKVLSNRFLDDEEFQCFASNKKKSLKNENKAPSNFQFKKKRTSDKALEILSPIQAKKRKAQQSLKKKIESQRSEPLKSQESLDRAEKSSNSMSFPEKKLVLPSNVEIESQRDQPPKSSQSSENVVKSNTSVPVSGNDSTFSLNRIEPNENNPPNDQNPSDKIAESSDAVEASARESEPSCSDNLEEEIYAGKKDIIIPESDDDSESDFISDSDEERQQLKRSKIERLNAQLSVEKLKAPINGELEKESAEMEEHQCQSTERKLKNQESKDDSESDFLSDSDEERLQRKRSKIRRWNALISVEKLEAPINARLAKDIAELEEQQQQRLAERKLERQRRYHETIARQLRTPFRSTTHEFF